MFADRRYFTVAARDGSCVQRVQGLDGERLVLQGPYVSLEHAYRSIYSAGAVQLVQYVAVVRRTCSEVCLAAIY